MIDEMKVALQATALVFTYKGKPEDVKSTYRALERVTVMQKTLDDYEKAI
jgi:hypothetical protein